MNYDKETLISKLAEVLANVKRADVLKVIQENGLRHPTGFLKKKVGIIHQQPLKLSRKLKSRLQLLSQTQRS